MAAREGTAATRIPGRNGINILSLPYRHQRKRRPFSERCGMRQPDRRFLGVGLTRHVAPQGGQQNDQPYAGAQQHGAQAVHCYRSPVVVENEDTDQN